MSPRLLFLLPVLALTACETAPVTYNSEPVDPNMGPDGTIVRRSGSSARVIRDQNSPPPRRIADDTPPIRRIDVYRSQSEIRGLHRVIGEVRLSTDGRESAQSIRSSFERQARSRNAQGVIIQDPADRSNGMGGGPGFDQPREITAVFIRYDDSRVSGYGNGSPSPYSNQGPSSSYQPQGSYAPAYDR